MDSFLDFICAFRLVHFLEFSTVGRNYNRVVQFELIVLEDE